jgi:hypothetical protein
MQINVVPTQKGFYKISQKAKDATIDRQNTRMVEQ